jgi:hypothetical protein
VRRVGVVDLTLKFANALLYFPPRALVEHTISGASCLSPAVACRGEDCAVPLPLPRAGRRLSPSVREPQDGVGRQ